MPKPSCCAGDRTKEALIEFAEALVPSAGQPHRYIRGVTRIAKTPGCNLSGTGYAPKSSPPDIFAAWIALHGLTLRWVLSKMSLDTMPHECCRLP